MIREIVKDTFFLSQKLSWQPDRICPWYRTCWIPFVRTPTAV